MKKVAFFGMKNYKSNLKMNAVEELRRMVELLNEKAFREPGASRLELRLQERPDLDGVMAFIVLVQDGHVDIDRKTVFMPIPPITLCWGGGTTADSACETAIRKFAAGSDLIRECLPFTAGSLAELELKLAVEGALP